MKARISLIPGFLAAEESFVRRCCSGRRMRQGLAYESNHPAQHQRAVGLAPEGVQPPLQAIGRDAPPPSQHQVAAVSLAEFRMSLNAQKMVAILQHEIGAELAARQQSGLTRRMDHLVLMTDQQARAILPRLHTGLYGTN